MAAVLLLLSAAAWFAGPAEAVSAQATVDLTSDTGSGALFDGSRPLGRARPQSACLSVGSTGAVSGDTVSIAAVDVSGPLADDLNLTVEMGTGGGGGSCTGFTGSLVWSGSLADLAAVSGDGVATGWQPAVTPTRTFRISAVIDASATVAGGASASGKFAWRLVPGTPPVTPTPTTATPTTATPTPTTPTTTSRPPSTTRTTAPTTPVPTTAAPETSTPETSEPATRTTAPETPAATGGVPVTSAPGSPPATTTPHSVPSGTIDNSLPTTPGTPSGSSRPQPTGSLLPGGGPGSGGSGGGSDTDVVLGAVTSVKTVPAKVGKAIGGVLASGLSPLLGAEAAERAGETVAAVIASPQYPLVVIVMAVLFLLVQYRIDARDPKLAKARVRQRDDELLFPDPFGMRAALVRRLPFLGPKPATPTSPTGTAPLPSPIESPPRRWMPWQR